MHPFCRKYGGTPSPPPETKLDHSILTNRHRRFRNLSLTIRERDNRYRGFSPPAHAYTPSSPLPAGAPRRPRPGNSGVDSLMRIYPVPLQLELRFQNPKRTDSGKSKGHHLYTAKIRRIKRKQRRFMYRWKLNFLSVRIRTQRKRMRAKTCFVQITRKVLFAILLIPLLLYHAAQTFRPKGERAKHLVAVEKMRA